MILIFIFTLCGCSKTNIGNYKKVELTFIQDDININVVLIDEEAERIVNILDNNKLQSPFLSGVPSCGFTKDVSIKVDSQTFAIACDKCETIQHMNSLRYFNISANDMEYIRSVFEKYGGYFPCI